MTDVATAFPSTSRKRMTQTISDLGARLTVIRWVNSWLTDRAVDTWIDGEPAGRMNVNCGVPQRSLCSPDLFALTLAAALKELPDGVSYVDDCNWTISFDSQRQFQRGSWLLSDVQETFERFGFGIDKDKDGGSLDLCLGEATGPV